MGLLAGSQGTRDYDTLFRKGASKGFDCQTCQYMAEAWQSKWSERDAMEPLIKQSMAVVHDFPTRRSHAVTEQAEPHLFDWDLTVFKDQSGYHLRSGS